MRGPFWAQVAHPQSQHCLQGLSPQALLEAPCPHTPEALSSHSYPFPLSLPSTCPKSLLGICVPKIVNVIQTLQVTVCPECLPKVLPQVLPGGEQRGVYRIGLCSVQLAQLYAATSGQRRTCPRTKIKGLLPGRVLRQSLCAQY